ncbi:hypothetical protein DPMN_164657 [Dreissena polymorpha]|uniref:Uncharacterized protein n=1 Tax=Dreissena polymorpha TaxID=45954 RepID=A0A9D4EU15_DREPO|nr:hypothetical protein DPMN_164657 [Dreissena polymorpha]
MLSQDKAVLRATRFLVVVVVVEVVVAVVASQLTQNQQIPRSAEFDDINCSRSRLGIDHLVAESPCLFAETRRGTPRHDAEEIVGDMTLMFGRTDGLTDRQTDRRTA